MVVHDMPGPELFAILPAELEVARAGECLLAFAETAPVASLLLPQTVAPTETGEEMAALARELGLAVLVENDVQLARVVQADGVHLNEAIPALVRGLRKSAREEFVIGACCPTRRHEAMELGEAGADYLMIDQRLEAGGENLLAWWAEMFSVPVVAGRPVAPEEVVAVLALGADFLVPADEIWANAEKARVLGKEYATALRGAGAEQSSGKK